jgi:hypothetical protein
MVSCNSQSRHQGEFSPDPALNVGTKAITINNVKFVSFARLRLRPKSEPAGFKQAYSLESRRFPNKVRPANDFQQGACDSTLIAPGLVDLERRCVFPLSFSAEQDYNRRSEEPGSVLERQAFFSAANVAAPQGPALTPRASISRAASCASTPLTTTAASTPDSRLGHYYGGQSPARNSSHT